VDVRKCSRCGRDASYMLRASGEPLCTRCLERTVIRAIRRALGSYKVLKPGSPIAVVEPIDMPPWFLLSLEVLAKSLGTHGNRLAVLSYSGRTSAGQMSNLPSGWSSIGVFEIGVERSRVLRLCSALGDGLRLAGCLLKAEYILGIAYSRLWGFEVVSLMRPRDLCSLVGLIGVIYMDPSIAIESNPLRSFSGITAIYPLYNVASADLAALAYLRRKYVWDENLVGWMERLKEEPGAQELLEIYTRSPELVYTSSETIRAISGTGGMRCSICGAPISSGDLCYICSHLYPLIPSS